MAIVNQKFQSSKRGASQWIADYRWLLITLMWLVTVILGYIGYSKFFLATENPGAIWDIIYNTMRLFTFTFEKVPGPLNTELQIARFLAPALSLYTALQAAADIFRDQFQHLRIKFMRNHIVICGLGQKGMLLASEYRTLGRSVIIIESDRQNKYIQNCKERGAIVLIGNAADADMLRKAKVQQAAYIFCTTGDDGVNAEIATFARELSQGISGRALSCLSHIIDLRLWDILREYEMGMGKLDTFRLNFFNIYESGARALLYKYPPFPVGNRLESEPHIFVIGIGRMGESLVINAIRRWKSSINSDRGLLRITLIDKEAQSKKEALSLRYPQLKQICELIPIDIDFHSLAFEKGDFLLNQNGKCDASIIYICPGAEESAITVALKLRKRLRQLEIPIIVRTESYEGLATILKNIAYQMKDTGNIYAFPLLKNTCVPDMVCGGSTYEIIAQAIHEDYIRNAVKRGETPKLNPSMVPWAELPESLKESNRNQAEHISTKLKSIGCDFTITTDLDIPIIVFPEDEIEKLARMEHERFVAERLRQKWKLGSSKDGKREISPTLIPWEELSEEEKDKDRNTVKAIPGFLSKAGYQVYRLSRQE